MCPPKLALTCLSLAMQGLVNLDKVRRELSKKLGRFPTPEEIAEYKNVSVELVKDVIKWYRGMDVTFNDFSDGWDEYTHVSLPGDSDGLLAMDEDFLKSDLEQCISTLPTKVRTSKSFISVLTLQD